MPRRLPCCCRYLRDSTHRFLLTRSNSQICYVRELELFQILAKFITDLVMLEREFYLSLQIPDLAATVESLAVKIVGQHTL